MTIELLFYRTSCKYSKCHDMKKMIIRKLNVIDKIPKINVICNIHLNII